MALNRFSASDSPCTLRLEIDDGTYLALDIRLLDLKDAKQLTQTMRSRKQSKTYVCGVDVVLGPLNLDHKNEQQKFESAKAENLLNDSQTTRTVI